MRSLLLVVVAILFIPSTLSQQTPPEVPEAAVPLEVPAKEKARKNPVEPTPESLGRGEKLFTTQCVMCHGARGDGKGDLVDRLRLQVPDYTDPEQQKRRTDGELFFILSVGHGSMPAQGDRFSEDMKWDIVNYMRSLAK